jgi:hypothetical protein
MTNALLTRLRIEPRPGTARALVALPFALLAAYLVARGWLYPLWPDTIGLLGHLFVTDPSLDGAWGGPTLAGAWAVHATIAVGLQAICLVVLQTIYRPAK